MQFLYLRKAAGRSVKRVLGILISIWAVLFFSGNAMAFWPFAPERQDPGPTNARLEKDLPVKEIAAVKPRVDNAKTFQTMINTMANELFRNLEEPDPEIGELADGVVVCSFVDLKKLYRTSSFGRYIAEQMMTEMQHRRYTVVELRKTNEVLVQEKKGEYGLSRNSEEIRAEVTAGAMLTGTYTPVQDHVIVNAKIVDNRTAKLLSSATVVFPRTTLINQLLKETASAARSKPEPLYMKRLEL